MKVKKKVSDIPAMNDDELEEFWEKHQPEQYDGWQEGTLRFMRPPKKLIPLRLDPRDARIIDKESKRTGINRAQLVRSWVREKIVQLSEEEKSSSSNREFVD